MLLDIQFSAALGRIEKEIDNNYKRLRVKLKKGKKLEKEIKKYRAEIVEEKSDSDATQGKNQK